MSRNTFKLIGALAAALLAACGSTNSTGGATPTPSSAQAFATPSQQAGAATSLDPCQLVTSQEASSLAGATFGAGQAETYSGTGRACIYGSQTLNILSVGLAVATDKATAQADWSQNESQAQAKLQQGLSQIPAGYTVNYNLTDVSVSGADKAAVGSASASYQGASFSVINIYLLKGSVFVWFGNVKVGGASPTASAMESEAQTVLGRIP